MWNRHLTHRDPSHRHGGGRNRATAICQDLFCSFSLDVNSFQIATSLNNAFKNGTGVHISTQTVRNRLHELGLNTRRPTIYVQLTRQHLQDWLDLTRIHVRWTFRDWMPVLFTDMSRYSLYFTERRQMVWRMPKERFHGLNVADHNRYGKGSVMVWTGISVSGKTDLCVIENGILTASISL